MDVVLPGPDLTRSLRFSGRSPNITSLPAGVLQEIFDLVADLGSNADGAWRYKWLQLLWVCQYWRRLALSSPRLWTEIIITHSSINPDDISRMHARAQAFIQYSQKAPIDVLIEIAPTLLWLLDAEIARQTLAAVFSIWTPHIARLRRLRFRGISPETLRLLVSIEVPAHQLQCLDFAARDSEKVVGLTSLFKKYMPALQELSLRQVAMPWIFPTLSNLTSLLIHLPSLGPVMEELFGILARSPTLRILNLDIPHLRIPVDTVSQSTMNLPFLQSLVLQNMYPESTTYLLSHLSFPDDASVDLGLRAENCPAFDVPYGCVSFMQRISGIQVLSIDSRGDKVSRECIIKLNDVSAIKFQIHWRFSALPSAGPLPEDMILPYLSPNIFTTFNNLRRLVLRWQRMHLHYSDWRYFLTYLPHLVSIDATLWHEEVEALVSALVASPFTDPATSELQTGGAVAICPRLTDLEMKVNYPGHKIAPTLINTVVKNIRDRAAMGAALGSAKLVLESTTDTRLDEVVAQWQAGAFPVVLSCRQTSMYAWMGVI